MAYVPTPDEVRRLRRAVDLASFREGERILWLLSFTCVLTLGIGLLFWSFSTQVYVAGLAGFFGGFVVLYWRLRGGHLMARAPQELRGLFTLDVRTREQRAFTALMLRHAFTGNNPLEQRLEHQRTL